MSTFTGDNDEFYKNLKKSIENAEEIDMIVSFLMESGVKLILNDLKKASKNNTRIRILTSTYLNITQPQALYLLKSEIRENLEIRIYNNKNKSFHPKAYIFKSNNKNEIYIGSSNLSKGALTSSIEWNYHFTKEENEKDFENFQNTFNNLFTNQSIPLTDKLLKNYSKNWTPRKTSTFIIKTEKTEPNQAQREALYELNKTREEGFDKALIVAATGTGKTYLAAFDSKNYKKILFIAHREEIIKQAKTTFEKVHKNKTTGFFYNNKKEKEKDITFALIQTIGKEKYLKEFEKDRFDYIIIDEFHHAVTKNYKNVLNHFSPEFMLGLTATPERLDNRDIYSLCDYNSVYEIRLKEAINKGYLSPFRYYGIYDDTVNYDKIKIKNNRYDSKDLESKLMIHKRCELVYNHFKKYPSKRALAFCSGKNHAEYMAEFFNKKGIKSAAVYSGNQGKYTENRAKAIEKLKNNNLKILFTVDMFNEGVDIPSIDTVLFLRPTQSPVIFLQQLGRGLRLHKDKKHLIILDFIGNYRKANLIPLLLSDTDNTKTLLKENILELDYPEDCYIDFDFKLIDLFKKQSKNTLKIKDLIVLEYNKVKDEIKRRPTRMDLFLKMDDNLQQAIRNRKDLNLFRDYLSFLQENGELQKEEESIINTKAHEFLKVLENTKMTKSYKMPILKAFYNSGDIRLAITEDDVAKSMKEYYSYKSNGVDMLKDKSTEDYATWDRDKYLKLAYRNPIYFLKKTHGEFFKDKEGYALALNEDLREYINSDKFKEHFRDIIDCRTVTYYKNRYRG